MKKMTALAVLTPLTLSLAGCSTVKIPIETKARDNFFMLENHRIEARCGWLGVIDVATGKEPYVYIQSTRQFQTGTNARMKDGSYLLDFNNSSLTFAFTPPKNGNGAIAGIIDSTGVIPCNWNFIAN
ncbi:TPA: hypothetical protein JHK28_000149 [Enterobacter cloacae]|nr:hypothetical protein [Enterobacter cloacae]